jgi:hypothetical protein
VSGIPLSPKHGVNPALGQCFWCGQEDGTVLLLGRLPGDAEAPRHVIASYEPCENCKAGMSYGVTLVEMANQPLYDGHKAMAPNAYPTGRWVVVRDETIERLFHPPELVAQVLGHRKAFVDQETWTRLMPEEQIPS